MEIRNSKSIRINFFSLFLIGSGSIALLLFSISLLLSNIYGRFEINEIFSAVKQMDLIPNNSEYSAAILFSDYSDKLLDKDNNWNENNIRTWQKFVESSELNLEIINDESIESGDFLKYQLLILPSSKALSNKQIIQIKQYLENGGNIFATSSTATFTEEGKWRGWKFFNEVFGIKFDSEFTGNGLIQKQSFRGGIPLTAGIPSGFSLRVASWDSPIACQIMEPRVSQIGFWNDFRTKNNFISNPIENMTSVVSGSYGKGRFVWMGFDINSVYGEQEEYVMFEKFFNNIMNWLTEKPIIFVKDWPSDYKSAVIVNVINNSEMSSLQNIINYIDKYSLPVTFFVNPELASQDVLKLKMLSQYGKIGALVALGNLTSGDKITYQLDNYKGQLERLAKAKKILDPILDTKINSALPLFGNYDENTLHALIGSDYEIIISDSIFNKSVPSSIIKGDNQIISINKTAYSDLEIDANFGLENLDFQLSTYKEDVDRIVLEGGLYNVNLHSSIFSNSSYNELFDELFSYFTNKNMWITSAEEIKDWWIAKNSIEVGIKSISDRRISFLITNPSDLVINNLIVQIDINKNIENLEIKSEIIGTDLPSYVYIKEKGQVLLKLQGLKAGQSNSYFIDFDNVIL